MNRQETTVRQPTTFSVTLRSGEQSVLEASMRFCCLRPVSHGPKVLLFSPYRHGKKTELPTFAQAFQACLPRGENPPQITNPADPHSRAGLRRVGCRSASHPRHHATLVAHGHGNHPGGKIEEPAPAGSPVPPDGGREPSGTPRSESCSQTGRPWANRRSIASAHFGEPDHFPLLRPLCMLPGRCRS
jgi:hypothetical protein